MDFVWHPLTPEQYAELPRWKKLRHRLEWSCLGSGAYYTRDVWWSKMIVFDPPAKWKAKIRRDRLFVFGFLLLAGLGLGWLGWATYGSVVGSIWMITKLLIVPFLLFQWTIGWVVHLHHIDPDIQWYKRREWNKFRGQMEGTTVLYTPAWLDFFLHRIFIHVPHHVDMRIPFYHLREASDAIIETFPGVVEERKLSLRDYLRNTKQCKLYDFDEARWLTYGEAADSLAAREASDVSEPASDGSAWAGTTQR
jgi:omega-6 fatty acid desaturase (delta-12 desaturase)